MQDLGISNRNVTLIDKVLRIPGEMLTDGFQRQPKVFREIIGFFFNQVTGAFCLTRPAVHCEWSIRYHDMHIAYQIQLQDFAIWSRKQAQLTRLHYQLT